MPHFLLNLILGVCHLASLSFDTALLHLCSSLYALAARAHKPLLVLLMVGRQVLVSHVGVVCSMAFIYFYLSFSSPNPPDPIAVLLLRGIYASVSLSIVLQTFAGLMNAPEQRFEKDSAQRFDSIFGYAPLTTLVSTFLFPQSLLLMSGRGASRGRGAGPTRRVTRNSPAGLTENVAGLTDIEADMAAPANHPPSLPFRAAADLDADDLLEQSFEAKIGQVVENALNKHIGKKSSKKKKRSRSRKHSRKHRHSDSSSSSSSDSDFSSDTGSDSDDSRSRKHSQHSKKPLPSEYIPNLDQNRSAKERHQCIAEVVNPISKLCKRLKKAYADAKESGASTSDAKELVKLAEGALDILYTQSSNLYLGTTQGWQAVDSLTAMKGVPTRVQKLLKDLTSSALKAAPAVPKRRNAYASTSTNPAFDTPRAPLYTQPAAQFPPRQNTYPPAPQPQPPHPPPYFQNARYNNGYNNAGYNNAAPRPGYNGYNNFDGSRK